MKTASPSTNSNLSSNQNLIETFDIDTINENADLKMIYQLYANKLNTQQKLLAHLKFLDRSINNIKRNIILLHNFQNKKQIVSIENFYIFQINKLKKDWKKEFKNLLMKHSVPEEWIVDIYENLAECMEMCPTWAKEFHSVYIKTINSIAKEKMKIILKNKFNSIVIFP